MKIVLPVVVGLICLSEWHCAKAKLTRRFQSMDRQAVQTSEQLVRVSAFVIETPEETKSTLYKLSDRGQAALITEMGKTLQTADALLSKLQTSQSGRKNTIDKTIFKKRVVFSVEKNSACPSCSDGRLSPADRINALKVNLGFADKKTRFRSWDRFSTQYQTVDLGEVSLDQTRGGMLTLAGPQGYNTASGGSQRELTEEVSLTKRYVALTGRLSETEADLALEGVAGIDLAGNFTVDLVLEVPAGDMVRTVVPNGLWIEDQPKSAEKISLTIEYRKIPASSVPRRAGFSVFYTVRHVSEGEATIGEDDDRVVFLSGEITKEPVEILTQKELEVVFFSLRFRDDQGAEREVQLSGPQELPLYFADFWTANEFLIWLKRARSTSAGSYQLAVDQEPLDPNSINKLFIKRLRLNE